MILGTLMIIGGLALATTSGGASLLLVALGGFWLWSEGQGQHQRGVEARARADLEAAGVQPVSGGGCVRDLLGAVATLVGLLVLLGIMGGILGTAGGG